MKYLFINTAISVSTIALIENDDVISIHEEYNANDLSSKIFLMIDKVFQESSVTPKDLSKIFVVNGPGSFTGIRIGLSIAKTMAWALNIDLIPISSLELLATTSSTKVNVALIDARRNYVYAGGYDEKLQIIMPDKYIEIKQLMDIFSNSEVSYISYDKFASILAEKPMIDYIKIIKKHEYDTINSCHKVNPVYLKLTEAEEKRKKDEH